MSSKLRTHRHSPLARLRHFACRDLQAQLLLGEALIRLVGLRLFLGVYGPKRQPRLYGRARTPAHGDAANEALIMNDRQQALARRIGWAIWRAERLLPFDVVCLPQALVGRRMLRNRGIASVMFFGVEQNKPVHDVGTHAWLVAGPVEVTGFPQAVRYRVFASYGPGPQPATRM